MAEKRVELIIRGMHCNNCALGVERHLKSLGATEVNVDFSSSSARFILPPSRSADDIRQSIEKLGYATGMEKTTDRKLGLSALEIRFLTCFAFTLPLLVPMWLPLHALHTPLIQWILATPVFIIGLSYFGRSAITSLRARFANMDVLIVIGIVAAYGYSLSGTLLGLGENFLFYETAATITTIVLFGNLLEERAVKKTTSAIEELHAIQPRRARKVTRSENGEEQILDVSYEEIAVGDTLLVNSGDRVPVDGKIIAGEASIDESMISGESFPQERGHGAAVIGGTVLLSGSIHLRAEAVGESTVLAHIILMVKDAQARKPCIQSIGDKVSSVFVPVVLTLSLLTLVVTYIVLDLSARDAILRAIAVLVIACPCAMGLATPTAVMVGIGKSAKSGILLKGGDTLQTLAEVQTVIFDKTGTLTSGDFKIKRIIPHNKDENGARIFLYSIARRSSHPISQSLMRELIGTTPIFLREILETKGIGIQARDESERLIELGGAKLRKRYGGGDDAASLYLYVDGTCLASVEMEDALRPGAIATLAALKERKIKTVLLSGDVQKRCEEIAQHLGIDEVYAEKLPQEKLEIVASYARSAITAFVGDGINDAPALAQASVGISLGGATHVAVQSAQVVLLDSNLEHLSKAIAIAKHTLRVIKQNLFWAFFYNVLAIPLAMCGILNPMVAALAMTFSDVFVIGNSLRLKARKV